MSRLPVFYVRASLCVKIWYGFTMKTDPLFPNKDLRDRPHMTGSQSRHHLLRIMQLRECLAAALMQHSAFCEPPEGDDNLDNTVIVEDHFPGGTYSGIGHLGFVRDGYHISSNGILRQAWVDGLRKALDGLHDMMIRCRTDLSLKLAGSPNGRNIKHWCDLSYKFHPALEKYVLDYRHSMGVIKKPCSPPLL